MFQESDALAAYRQQLAKCSALSEAKEKALTEAWRSGNRRAGDQLVSACLPFVFSIAMEYRRWGVPLEDIIQQGNIGLLRAAERFDTAKCCRLITYAAYWIRAEIREYLVRSYRVVRLGTTKGERRALRLYRTTREESVDALAEKSGLSKERAEKLMPLLTGRDVSLDAETGDRGAILDRLASEELDPEEAVSSAELDNRARRALDEALGQLTPRELLIVRTRWADDDTRTLESIGQELGVSKERVRQIEERTRNKLREKLAAQGFSFAAA